ncbi:universal stress protein [Emcibacter sp. SYSU 3D8]|uniref:universal stress protein n=1 Tax=Emcibacter sp. SYSU 3D8 TaxID=3133969 RepID=UPI0031FEA38C
MAIRNILFHAFEGQAGQSIEDVAFSLAQLHGASLTALCVIENMLMPSYVVPYVPANIAESYIDEARAAARKIEERIKAREAATGIRTEWRYHEGDIRAIFAQHSHYTDLVLLAQGTGDDVPIGPANNLPGDLVLTAGRPVMVVPWHGASLTVGKRVIIGWNSSKEATRALNDALPILEKADAVKVLTIGDDDSRHIPGAEIAQHLARHGVNAEADHVADADGSPGSALVFEAKDFGADLLVCGAWGHSRMFETVLGGVTRDLLRGMELPLLLSH